MSAQKKKILVAWDFDLTIIDANCDFYYFDTIEPECTEICKDHYRKGNDHVSSVNKALDHWYDVKKRDWNDIKNGMIQVPFPKSTQETIKMLHENGVEQIIISTANHLYIETILKHFQLDSFFSHIWTNPSHLDQNERVIVQPFHGTIKPPHNCSRCDPCFCKGTQFEAIVQENENADRILVYVGDSASGDYCPATRLRSQDFIFARKNFPLAKELKKSPVQANVVEWDYESILKDFESLL